MDRLHGVLKTLGVDGKSAARRRSPPDHLGVFREFLHHLDRIQHKAPAKPRLRVPRRTPKRTRKG